MRKTVISLLVVLVTPCIAKYSGGSGEPNDPYQISNSVDLLKLATDTNDYNKCFILTADIDLDPNLLGGCVFTTAIIAQDIDNSNHDFDGIAFTGIFDGGGYKIFNLTIDTHGVGNDYLGLFGAIAPGGAMKNLGLENISIFGGNSSEYLGGLIGYNYGSISNCYVTGDISGGENSYNLGGLVGWSFCDINNCYSKGIFTGGDNSSDIGGLVGENRGNINNSYSTGIVTGGNNSSAIGGLVGYNGYEGEGILSNCYATNKVVGDYVVGGLVGMKEGIVCDCFSTGAVNGNSYLGGLVGRAWYGDIINCYSSGSVTGEDFIGGLAGDNQYYSYIHDCFSTGTVSKNSYCGGLVGTCNPDSVSGCYFLNISGFSNGCGAPLTGEQMKQQGSFTGWDFVNVWHICENSNYPKLIWQIPRGDIACPDGVDIFDLLMLCDEWLLEQITFDLVPSGGDGIVNFDDFVIIANQWESNPDLGVLKDFTDEWLRGTLHADIGPRPFGDGIVNFIDFAVIARDWMTCSVTEAIGLEPANNEFNVRRNVILRWLPGQSCTSHHIFFGTDFDEVNNADITSPTVYMGNQDVNCWDINNYDPCGLGFDTTYYWRIDEVSATCSVKGNVWQFTVNPLGKAENPQPSDGQENLLTHLTLSWFPAINVISHDVYFGTSYTEVNVATNGSQEYMGNQISNIWDINNYAPTGLNLGTTYYWRIDERALDYTTKGDVWGFKVALLEKAKNPQPSDGQTKVIRHPVLRWSPALVASSHDMYLGTSYSDVNSATKDSSVYIGNQDVNFCDTRDYDPCGLDFNTTYYWRIDELYDIMVKKGDIWSFKTIPEVDPDLKAWWKFNEGSGFIAYDSAGDNDGNLINGPSWTTGKIGGGLCFDGIDDYVKVSDNPSLGMSSIITIAAWVYLNDLNNTYFIVTKQPSGSAPFSYPGNYEFGIAASSGLLSFRYQNNYGSISSYVSSLGVNAGVWHHVAVTFGNTQIVFYIDGVPASAPASSHRNSGVGNNEPVRIGTRKDCLSFFNGSIDDVRIYNKALSADEINLLYQQEL